MVKHRWFHAFWLRFGLELLVWEAVVLALAWMLFSRMHWGHYFSDVLFAVGVLELMAASVGMLGRPYETASGGYGVPALPVQPSEQERREQAVAEYIEKRSFALRLGASGLLTVLAALIVL